MEEAREEGSQGKTRQAQPQVPEDDTQHLPSKRIDEGERMNQTDRKLIAEAKEGIAFHLAALEELVDSLEERVANIEEHFESGNHISEALTEEAETLREVMEEIETANDRLDEVGA
jgi:methyl-accepting chemotaxis protein